MSSPHQHAIAGAAGRIVVHHWSNKEATFVALIAHGYAEHARRYDHVAERLVREGATVYAPDHHAHGESEGEPGLVDDGEVMSADLHTVADLAREENPGLPVVLVGHSMGGLISTRFVQRYPGELSALVLSGPVIGGNPTITGLLEMDPIPEVPIDPAVLSRDPAVGERYAADPLVYSGPFKRETLQMFVKGVEDVHAGDSFGDLPVLWIHGSDDALAPVDYAREAVERLRGPNTEEKVYPEARHEIFNETNQGEVLDDTVDFVKRALDAS